jgi:lysophospholipase L1-like esterase
MRRIVFLMGIAMMAASAGAQTATPAATVGNPAPGTQTLPSAPAPATATPSAPGTSPGIQTSTMTHEQQLATDWAQLYAYKAANAGLAPPTAGEGRVVFYGDSITQGWDIAKSFPGKPYVNRGISGQTTPQMLVRFRQDVIALKPQVVVILAGTNDIAQNTGPETLEQIEDNFASMAELARANNIRVVLSSITPVYDYPWRAGMQPVQKIAALNGWLRSYAAAHGEVYLDYYSAMQDERHGLPVALSPDGVHPNAAGYAVMAPLAEKAIGEAEK